MADVALAFAICWLVVLFVLLVAACLILLVYHFAVMLEIAQLKARNQIHVVDQKAPHG